MRNIKSTILVGVLCSMVLPKALYAVLDSERTSLDCSHICLRLKGEKASHQKSKALERAAIARALHHMQPWPEPEQGLGYVSGIYETGKWPEGWFSNSCADR